jgi:hypothetical protein
MHAIYFRRLETGNEYLPTGTSPATDDGKSMEWNCTIPFLNLEKVYHKKCGQDFRAV